MGTTSDHSKLVLGQARRLRLAEMLAWFKTVLFLACFQFADPPDKEHQCLGLRRLEFSSVSGLSLSIYANMSMFD